MALRYISLWTIFDEAKYDRLVEIVAVIRDLVATKPGIESWEIFGSRDSKMVLFHQQFDSFQDLKEYEEAVDETGVRPELRTLGELVYSFSLGQLTDDAAKSKLAESGGVELRTIQSK